MGIPNNLDSYYLSIPNPSRKQTDVLSLSILFLRPEDQALPIEAPKDNYHKFNGKVPSHAQAGREEYSC